MKETERERKKNEEREGFEKNKKDLKRKDLDEGKHKKDLKREKD